MDEYKPVTGELRRRGYLTEANIEVDGAVTFAKVYFGTKDFRDLCDNIDAVHAQLERDFDRIKAERDSMAAALDAAQGEHAYAPESHYMLLPKDADGVPIHVGDRLRNDSGKEVTVVGVGDGTFFTFFSVGVNHAHYAADFRHAKPDSWERIVEDAIDGLCYEDELVARCKALAGEK